MDSRFYDTIGLSVQEYKEALARATKQDKDIYNVFLEYSDKELSASDIQLYFIRKKEDIINLNCKSLRKPQLNEIKRILGSFDSIKRSINTLCSKHNLIIKVGKKKGAFRLSETTYTLNKIQ